MPRNMTTTEKTTKKETESTVTDHVKNGDDSAATEKCTSPRKLRERKKSLALQASNQETEDSSSKDNEIYEVDQILSMKTVRGKRKFLIKWKGFDSDHDSWEPEENLSGSRQLVAEYVKDNEIFEVDRILSMKTVRGKRKFLIKWKGFDSDHDSWEPEENLSGSRQLVAEYVKENSQLSGAASQDLANNLQQSNLDGSKQAKQLQDHQDNNHVDSSVDMNGPNTKREDSRDGTSDTGDSSKIEPSDNKTTVDSTSAEENEIASEEDANNKPPQKCEKCEASKSKIPARQNVKFTRMFFNYRDKTIRYVGTDQNTKKLHNYSLTEAYSADAWSLVCFFHSKVSLTSSGEGAINIKTM
ncbi:chromo (CHRromatin organization MOdifier) domain-containing protein [Ditylenchus destructor]|uniref:Chromo (CHRromatin organization MOdifier) domain-containing protein n=1 Tax=Ditylenchus destructor TaxID=166010 RepID=A0AAD4R2V9_9BILA|nr:chromo (CHRromatin organization MOdifier) domain-containing protein [Ditylenchus destructor]